MRCAGYDSKVAFAHVKEYYRLKRDHPEQCDNITPEQIKHVLEQELITLLPRRDQYGRRILVMQFASNEFDFHMRHFNAFMNFYKFKGSGIQQSALK